MFIILNNVILTD